MSKAMLVIDMPENCLQCELSTEDDFTCFCLAHKKECSTVKRLDDCPLKEVPEKKQHTLYSIGAWNSGYNACIDDILEGSVENG